MTGPVPAEQVSLAVELGPLRLEHPLVDASGTFDILEYARRYRGDFFADFPYAAYVPKTVTADARPGNPAPRVTETPAGMINAIGLENPGIDAWIGGLPEWAALRRPVIVSVGGNSPDQYAAVVRALEAHLASAPEGTAPRIEGYELNGQRHLFRRDRPCHGVTSSRANTGPSLHTRSLPRVVSTTQPWHEPLPQAMCASSEA